MFNPRRRKNKKAAQDQMGHPATPRLHGAAKAEP